MKRPSILSSNCSDESAIRRQHDNVTGSSRSLQPNVRRATTHVSQHRRLRREHRKGSGCSITKNEIGLRSLSDSTSSISSVSGTSSSDRSITNIDSPDVVAVTLPTVEKDDARDEVGKNGQDASSVTASEITAKRSNHNMSSFLRHRHDWYEAIDGHLGHQTNFRGENGGVERKSSWFAKRANEKRKSAVFSKLFGKKEDQQDAVSSAIPEKRMERRIDDAPLPYSIRNNSKMRTTESRRRPCADKKSKCAKEGGVVTLSLAASMMLPPHAMRPSKTIYSSAHFNSIPILFLSLPSASAPKGTFSTSPKLTTTFTDNAVITDSPLKPGTSMIKESLRMSSAHQVCQACGNITDSSGLPENRFLHDEPRVRREDSGAFLVFYGPPPTSVKEDENRVYLLPKRWAVRISVNPLSLLSSKQTIGVAAKATERETFLVRNIRAVPSENEIKIIHKEVANRLEDGHCNEALSILSDQFLPKLVRRHKLFKRKEREYFEQFSQGQCFEQAIKDDEHPTASRLKIESILRYTRRNIATLRLYLEQNEQARDILWEATKWSYADVVSHALLGMSLLATASHEDAIRVFFKTMVLLLRHEEKRCDTSDSIFEEDGSANNHTRPLSRLGIEHKCAVAKTLNNIGCSYYEGTDYGKAKRTLELALQVFHDEEFDAMRFTVYTRYSDIGPFFANSRIAASSSSSRPSISVRRASTKYTPHEEDDYFYSSEDGTSSGKDTKSVEDEKMALECRYSLTITYCNLARTLIKLKMLEEAVVLLKRALLLQKRANVKDKFLTFAILDCLAYVGGYKLKNNAVALKYYEELLLELQDDIRGDPRTNEVRRMNALSHISFIHLKDRDMKAANQCLHRLLGHQEALLSPSHREARRTRESIEKLEAILASK